MVQSGIWFGMMFRDNFRNFRKPMAEISCRKMMCRLVLWLVSAQLWLVSAQGRRQRRKKSFNRRERFAFEEPGEFFPSKNWDVQDDGLQVAEHFGAIVRDHSNELQSEMKLSREYSERRACHGTLGEIEAAMLYLLIRLTKPRRVLEVGALCGYSTRWILAALARNRFGHLDSYDLRDVVTRVITKNLDRWSFQKKDIATAKLPDYDVIFIDALHMNRFAKMYTRHILGPVNKTIPVVVHDIYNPLMMPPYKHCHGGGTIASFDSEVKCMQDVAANWTQRHRADDFLYGPTQPSGEGQELLAWLARTSRSASSMITFQPYNAPTFAFTLRDIFITEKILDTSSLLNNPAAFFKLRGWSSD